MAISLNLSGNILHIALEAEKLSAFEQKELLAYLSTLNMQKEKRKPIAKPAKGLKPLTMEDIDRIKHESRNYYTK